MENVDITLDKDTFDTLAILAILGIIAIGVGGAYVGYKATEFVQRKIKQFKCNK